MHPSRKTRITEAEARAAVQHFTNRHFDNPGEKSRASIPANENDDDILLMDYITQREAAEEPDLQREAVEKVCACAVEAIAQVEEWLGSASTRQAAEESWWRLRRALQRAGYEMKNGCLEYRGSILRAMEHAGIGMDDEGVIRIRRYTDKPWMHASGVPLYEHLYRHPARDDSSVKT